jgi:hypothetical protein
VGGGDLAQRRELPEAGVGEEDVEVPLLTADRFVEAIQVRGLRDVALAPLPFLPRLRTAWSSSCSRRPVMKT